MNLKGFLKECHEKGVFKMLSIYIVSSWVILQVLALISNPLGLPEKSITYLILILLAGFPLYMFYIWKFYLAPFERQEIELDENGKWKKSAFQKKYFSTLVTVMILTTFSVILIINNNFSSELKLDKIISNDKIAVLEFENFTNDTTLNNIGEITAKWIIHGINEHTDEKVISPKIVDDYAKINADASAINNISFLKNYFSPNKIIAGDYYLVDDKLIFHFTVNDGNMDETLISFNPIECDSNSPFKCIEQIKQVVLGYLVYNLTKETEDNLGFEETPPKFEAYQLVLNANDKVDHTTKDYLDLINQAIAIDSNYFEPKIHKMSYYYNIGKFRIADSIRKGIAINSKTSARQRNYFFFYESLLKGNNDKTYSSHKKEYKLAYYNLTTNMTNMNIAVQYVNRPEDVEAIFNEISMEDLPLEKCTNCGFRYYLKGLADLNLKKYFQVIEMLNPVVDRIEGSLIKIPLIIAYIKSENFNSLDNYMSKIELTATQEQVDFDMLTLIAGKQLLIVNQKDKANQYFNKIIKSKNPETNEANFANAIYFKEDYPKAENLFEKLLDNDSTNIDYLVRLSISKLKNGKSDEANKLILTLDKLKTDYQYGAVDYGYAQYYAINGNKEVMMDYLLKAVASGIKFRPYRPSTFQYDPHFKAFKDTPEFQVIMNFWH